MSRGTALVPTDASDVSGSSALEDGEDATDANGHIDSSMCRLGAERSLVQIQSPRFTEVRFHWIAATRVTSIVASPISGPGLTAAQG